MSYQKLIHDYLSGDISAEEEKQLFDNISTHPEWQEEFALQLRMEQSAQKFISTVPIPAATTSSIFASLGFGVPPNLKHVNTRNVFSQLSTHSILSGISLIVALFCLGYVLLKPATNAPSDVPSKIEPAVSDAIPDSKKNIEQDKSVTTSETSHSALATLKHVKSLQKEKTESEVNRAEIPNEPIKAYFDIEKFSSVDYLTQMKIIGVADEGKIYCSEDGGKSWILQTSRTSSDLFGVNFTDTVQGIVVGARGTILFTADAGRDWKPILSGTKANLITVRYATHDTVFACGAQGTIMRSIDGGTAWQGLQSGTSASLFKIHFDNGTNGIVSGEHGLTLQTHDAGASWLPKQ
ncbi:MAG: YCF48-related protein [Ignavibacteriota bacterium]